MFFEVLEERRLMAGVTILTHGHQGSINGWIRTATDAIADRIGEDDVSRYVMRVTEVSADRLGVTSFELEDGPGIDKSVNAEAIVRLDWTAVDNGDFSTAEVGDAVAEYLLTTHGSQRPVAGFPIHLIGHSRGASVVSIVAKRLGERGVWVDQATYLDQHPVNGGIDDGFIDYGDPSVRGWDNITFVDNYWRSDGLNLEPDGDDLDAAYEGDLNDSVGEQHSRSPHMAVTAYYNGTIDLTATHGGDEPIYAEWYGGSEPARDSTGYAFSRLGGKARPVSGLRPEFGGEAPRAETEASGSQWGNIDDLQVLEGTTYTIGEKIPLRIKQQDRDDGYTITLWIDRDRNPYNDNNIRKIRSLSFGETDAVTPTRINGSSSDIEPGKYYVYARITDSGDHARYTYSRRITLVAPDAATQRLTGVFSSRPIEAPASAALPAPRAADEVLEVSSDLDAV